MRFNDKRLFTRGLFLFSVGNLVCYALIHTSNLLMNEDIGIIIEYARVYFTMLLEFITPVLGAGLMIIEYAYKGIKKALLGGLLLSLSRIFYALFYYYMYFIALGYDSLETVPLTLGVTALVCLITFAQFFALFGIAILALRLALKRRKTGLSADEAIRQGMDNTSLLSPSLSVFVCFGSVAVCQFLYRLILEIVDTVSFLIEYGGGYTLSELLLMLFNYLLIFILLILSYGAVICMKNKIITNRLETED